MANPKITNAIFESIDFNTNTLSNVGEPRFDPADPTAHATDGVNRRWVELNAFKPIQWVKDAEYREGAWVYIGGDLFRAMEDISGAATQDAPQFRPDLWELVIQGVEVIETLANLLALTQATSSLRVNTLVVITADSDRDNLGLYNITYIPETTTERDSSDPSLGPIRTNKLAGRGTTTFHDTVWTAGETRNFEEGDVVFFDNSLFSSRTTHQQTSTHLSPFTDKTNWSLVYAGIIDIDSLAALENLTTSNSNLFVGQWVVIINDTTDVTNNGLWEILTHTGSETTARQVIQIGGGVGGGIVKSVSVSGTDATQSFDTDTGALVLSQNFTGGGPGTGTTTNALTDGNGIADFTFNGSAAASVSVDFAGNGSANTVSRSDHSHSFSDVTGNLGLNDFPTGGATGQVLKRTSTAGTVSWEDDTSELAASVVISDISLNQVAGTPTETLLTFASTQEAAEFAATNGIVNGTLASTVTFTLTHDGDVHNYSIPSGGTPARGAVISGNTIAFEPQVPGVVEVHGATAVVDHTFDHLDSGNLSQLTFVDADTASYDVISETVLTDSDAVLPTSGAVHDYVEDKFLRDGTPAVQYWEVDGVPNGGPTFTGSGATVAEVLEFSDFRTDDSFRPVFGVDNAPIVDTIAFSINNVGDAATTVNNGDWTVAIENNYKVIFTKNGQTVIKTLLRGDGSASVVSTDLLCLAYDPMKIPGDNTRAGEKIYIGTENETVLVLDLNEIDFNGDGTITVAVAKYGLRGSLTPSSEQINITALGVHYRKVEHLSVVRWIQTVVFGTSIGSLPWISAEVGEGGNFTNFLDLENAENEGGTTGNIYQSSNDQNNTYETQRGYTLDGGVPFEFSHAAVRSIAWNADADGGITMIAVGDSILRPSQDQSFAEGRVPLFAVGQYWGIPMGPLAEQYLGSDTPTNRQTLFSNLEFSPLTYLGVVSGGISDANSTYPGGFKTNFLHNQLNTQAGIDIDNDLNVIHLSDIVYQEGPGAGFYMVGRRLASDSDYHGIGLFVDFQEFSLVTYNRDNTYLRFEKGLTNERASRVKIINSLTNLGANDNSPHNKIYFRNNTGDASDRNIIAFGNNRQALEVNTTVTTGGTAWLLSTADQFEELVNNNDGPFFASSDNFWGGFIPNKDDFSKTTVLWGTRSSVDVASSIFNAFRLQQEVVEIKFFDHSSPTAGPTLSIPKTNGEDIRSFAEKFAAHFGAGQTFPNGTATLIPATDPNVSESAITVEFDPDTTKSDDFTITVHVNNFNLLQPVNAGQTQYSLPITESFDLEVVDGTTDLILGYQLAVPSFDGLPNFTFSVTVGGQDASAGATLVNGLLELNATTVAGLTTPGSEGDVVTVNYLQASDEFYDFNEDLATIISYIDPYSGTNTIRGSFKISLDHTFNNEGELAEFLVSELESSGLLTSSVEARVVGTELIFEIGLNSKGPILHENQKISIVVDNPVLDPPNADPLTVTRRLNGDTDETGSESGPIDLREVPSRDEMIDFIESAVEELGTNEGIGNLDVIDSTGVPFKVDALDEEVLLSNDPLTTQSYVDSVAVTDAEVASASLWQEGLRNDYPASSVVFDNIAAADGSRRDFTRTGISIQPAGSDISRPGDNTYTLVEDPTNGFFGLLVDPNLEWVARYYVDIIWRNDTQYYKGDTVQYIGPFGAARRAYCEVDHISTEANNPAVLGSIRYNDSVTAFNSGQPWTPVESAIDISTGTIGETATTYRQPNINSLQSTTQLRDVRVWDSFLGTGTKAGQFGIILGSVTTTTGTIVEPLDINGPRPESGDRFFFGPTLLNPTSDEYELTSYDIAETLNSTYDITVEITVASNISAGSVITGIATNGFGRLGIGDTAVFDNNGTDVTLTITSVDETNDTIGFSNNSSAAFTLTAGNLVFTQDTSALASFNYAIFFFELPDGVSRVPEHISINDFLSLGDTRDYLGHTNRLVFRDDHFNINREGIGESFIEIDPSFSGIYVDRTQTGDFDVTASIIGDDLRILFSVGAEFRQFLSEVGFPDNLTAQAYAPGLQVDLNIATSPASRFLITSDAVYTYDSSAGSFFTVPLANVTTVAPAQTGFGRIDFEIQEYQFNNIEAGTGISFTHLPDTDNLIISATGTSSGGFTNGQVVQLGAGSTLGGTTLDLTGAEEITTVGNQTITGDWEFNGDVALTSISSVGSDVNVNARFDFVTAPIGSGLFSTIRNTVTAATGSGGLNVDTNANFFRPTAGAGITIDDVTTPGFTEFSVNRIVGDGFISIADQTDVVTKTGPVESITTFTDAITDSSLTEDDRPGQLLPFTTDTNLNNTSYTMTATGGGVTTQWNLVTQIGIRQGPTTTNPIITRINNAGEFILVYVDEDNWALFETTSGSIGTAPARVNVQLVSAHSKGGADQNGSAIVASSTPDYDITSVLRYADATNSLNSTGIFELLSAGLAIQNDNNVQTNLSYNSGNSNAMAYLAMQFTASVPVEITADNQTDSTTDHFGTTIEDVVNGQSLDFMNNIYLFYSTSYANGTVVLVDTITPDGADTTTVTRIATVNGTVVPQI